MTGDSPLRWVRKHVFQATQEDMAAIGGVSRPRVSRYESGGEPPPFGFMERVWREARRRGRPFSADAFFEVPAEAPVWEDVQ